MAQPAPALHDWELTPTEAVALQRRLRGEVDTETSAPVETIGLVAGADVSFDKGDDTLYAGIVVVRLPELETVEEVGVVSRARFPYVPGLLSFREAPAVLEAWAKLRVEPDAAMFDGQGRAHPRRVGIACHVGLWINRPAWGCAKSLLVGRFDPAVLGPGRGASVPLVDRGEAVGAALRTKDRTNPVFVSAGHRLDLRTAVELTLRCGVGKYRLPEPTRRAHLLVNALRRAGGKPVGEGGGVEQARLDL